MPKCNEDGCDVLKTGVCVNQFEDLKKCPHYLPEDESSSEVDSEKSLNTDNASDDSSKKSENNIKVYSGLSLLEDEVNDISIESYTHLIILAGMPDAGKTTALLSLMHQFETHSDYCNYLFSGSRTLLDFEQKSWPSRIDSKNENADTNRTNDMMAKFVHLQIAHKDFLHQRKNLLFTDISGEFFKTLRDSNHESQNFVLANRADHFALFFDADALSDVTRKHLAKVSGLGILKNLTDAGVLRSTTRIQIIFSRWDLFEGKQNKEIHESYIDGIRKEILDIYGSKFKISFVQIASRPSNSNLPFAYGIDKLFNFWMTESQLDFNHEIPSTVTDGNIDARQFSQYTFIK